MTADRPTVNRRQLLTAFGGVTITGASVWLLTGGLNGSTSGLPVRVETMRARGSEQGTIELPVPDTVTVIDLFATWCTPCVKQMNALATVAREYDDEDAVTFVSVTNERTGETLSREDIRQWWHRHDGNWTVGHDPDSSLMAALNASGLPYLAISNADGTITWHHNGITTAKTLRSKIEAAR